jgi:hypothetical protein
MKIISALLGHSKIPITEHSYGKIVNKKIAEIMAVFLWELKGA